MTLALSSCAANRVSLISSGTVRLDLVPTRENYVSRAYVNKQAGETVVSGYVSSRHLLPLTRSGHVDVEVIAPDGTKVRQCANYSHPFLVRASRELYFSERLPFVPEPGSVVRLAYHEEPSSEEDWLHCS